MPDERQTLEQRHQMSDIERLRHSAAHVLATAILRIWPEAQFAAGPPVENGFYYDLDMPHRISPEDFAKIEEEMKKEIKANHVFERTVVSREEAIRLADLGELGGLRARPGNPSKFKIGNLQDIPEGEEISLFRNGDFLDLCAGPHVMRTGNIGAFRLTHVASAYYKGDEKNPQLQRIYGTAFKNKTQLDEYFTMLEEAKKRDHRKLGKEMELFCFDDDVGPGLPLWLPRGTVLIEELEKLAKETEFAAGYDRVRTPALARENLYLTSGHLPYYAESMFPPMELEGEADPRVAHAPSRVVSGALAGNAGGGATYSHRRLPHFERPWAKYAVTFTTHERHTLEPAARDIVLASILYAHEHGQYVLYAACVMPNHAHLLFEPQIKGNDADGNPEFFSLSEILQAIKSSTAHRINKLTETSGVSVWEKEWFDRMIRSDKDLEEKFQYVCGNPWNDGVARPGEDYPWLWTPHEASAGAPKPAREARALPERSPGDRYYLKAMNCPHHHKLFGAVPRSYRDLPLRLAEYGTCYRYEQSGELFGLMRVRAMQMNDAHIYCTEEQFAAEFEAVNQMYLKYFKIFGIDRYQFRFSTHGPDELGKKYVDHSELWLKTEKMVRDVLVASGAPFVEVANEAAFYGPKIDIQIWNVIGKEFTLATNQVDFAVPARFGLTYKDKDNTSKTPLCIHRAPLGTHERFIGFLIEHYAGNFPLWLAPEQVRILSFGDDEPLVAAAKALQAELRAEGVRATVDITNDPIKAKVADAEQRKVHTMLVIGPRDLESGNVSVRIHGQGNLGAKPRAEVVADIFAAIKERRA